MTLCTIDCEPDDAGSDDDLGGFEAQQPPSVSETAVPGRRQRATDAADESSRIVESASIERDAAGLSSPCLGASSDDSMSRFHQRRWQGREGSSVGKSDEGEDEVPGVGAVLHGGHAAFYRHNIFFITFQLISKTYNFFYHNQIFIYVKF